MFQRTLALRTNPFNPQLPGLNNLAGEPLRVDEHAELCDLLCWQMGKLPEHQERIKGLTANPMNQGIVVVRGGRGTGKTTLASYVKQQFLKAPAPQGQWAPFDEIFPLQEGPPNLADVETRLEALREAVVARCGDGPASVLLFLDNLPSGGTELFQHVVNLYQSLNRYFRLALVTTEDENLTNANLEWYAPTITPLDLQSSTRDDLHQYVRQRVSCFRDPNRAEIDATSELFPFAPEAVERMMGGTQVTQKPLRIMNHRFAKAIASRHDELVRSGEHDDVATLSPAQLAAVLIR